MDQRYGISYSSILNTFSVRVFKNTIPMVLEVFEQMKTSFYVESKLCLSHAPNDLFKFLFQIFELHKKCPNQAVVVEILKVCYRLLNQFQIQFRLYLLCSEEINLENYCALTNSNTKFISQVRAYCEEVRDSSGIPLDEIQRIFHVNEVNKLFLEISNYSFSRIQELVKHQVAERFMDITDYKSIVIVNYELII